MSEIFRKFTPLAAAIGAIAALLAGYGIGVDITHNAETAIPGFLWGAGLYTAGLQLTGRLLDRLNRPAPWITAVWLTGGIALMATIAAWLSAG